MMNVATTDIAYEEMTQGFKDEFINQIIKREKELVDDKTVPIKARFREAAKRYQYINSLELYNRLADVFRREIALLNDFKNGNYTNYVKASRKVDERVEILKQELNFLESLEIFEWRKNVDHYQIELLTDNVDQMNEGFENCNKSPSQNIAHELMMSAANLFYEKLKILTPKIIDKLKKLCEDCDLLIINVIENYIKQWKFYQQKYGKNDFNINGADLEKLHYWCENLARIVFKILEIINSINESQQQCSLNIDGLTSMLMTLCQSLTNSLIKLIRGSVIIETQPPQVIKTNTK